MTLKEIEETAYKELSKAIVDGLYEPLTKAFIDGMLYVDKYYGIKSEWLKDLDKIEKREKFSPIYSIRRFLDYYKDDYFKDLDATTRNWTLHHIKMVIEEGGTSEDLWKRLQNTKGMTPKRAEVIYRTEMNRAFNWGMCTRLSHIKSNGYVRCAKDERSCSECIALDGQIGTPEELRKAVPRHPNCRCMILPLKSKDEVTKDNPDLEFEEDLFGENQKYYNKELAVARRYLNDHPEVTDQEWKYFIEDECPIVTHDLRDWTRSVQHEGGRKLLKTERSFTTPDKFRPPRKDSWGNILEYEGEIDDDYIKEYLKASAYHRAGFERTHKEGKIRLYRGSTVKKDSQYLSAPLESYTTDVEVAKSFAGKEGNIIYRDFDLNDIRFAHPYFGLPQEYEVVISHRGPYEVKIWKGD